MSTGSPSPRRAAYGLAVLTLLGFVLTTDMTLTALMMEPMKRDLALSDVQVALLQGTAFGLALGIASIPMGRLIDRYSRRLLISLGVACWTAALTTIALSSDLATLMAARVVLGVVAALVVPAGFSLAADLYPVDRRSFATSLLVVGQAMGQGAGMLGGGLAYDMLVGWSGAGIALPLAPWRMLYLGASVIGLVLLILLAFFREPVRQEITASAVMLRAAVADLWSYRQFLVPLLVGLMFAQVTIQAASIWASPLLIRRGLTPGEFAGWMSAVLLGGGILGALAGGWFAEVGRRRVGRRGVLIPAALFSLVIAPGSLFVLSRELLPFAALLTLNIFAGAVVATIGCIAVTLVIPNEIRGLALGTNTFVTAVFGAAGAPTAVAVVSTLLGGEAWLSVSFVVVCVPSALASFACFIIAYFRNRQVPLNQLV
jgi:MFS family permease